MPPNTMLYRDLLRSFGAANPSIVLFGEHEPRTARYSGLYASHARDNGAEGEIVPIGAVEAGSWPSIYLFERDSLYTGHRPAASNVTLAIKTAWHRGDGQFIGVIDPEGMDVYAITPSPDMMEHVRLSRGNREHSFALVDLVSGGAVRGLSAQRQDKKTQTSVHRAVYARMRMVMDGMADGAPTGRLVHPAVKLLCHAILVRILVERGIVTENNTPALFKKEIGPYDELTVVSIIDQTVAKYVGQSAGKIDRETPIFYSNPEVLQHFVCRQKDDTSFSKVPAHDLAFVLEEVISDSLAIPKRYLSPSACNFVLDDVTRATVSDNMSIAVLGGSGPFPVVALQRLIEKEWARKGSSPSIDEIQRLLDSNLFIDGEIAAQHPVTQLCLYLEAEHYIQEARSFDATTPKALHASIGLCVGTSHHAQSRECDAALLSIPHYAALDKEYAAIQDDVVRAKQLTKSSGIIALNTSDYLTHDDTHMASAFRHRLCSHIKVVGVLRGIPSPETASEAMREYSLIFARNEESVDDSLVQVARANDSYERWYGLTFDETNAITLSGLAFVEADKQIHCTRHATTLESGVVVYLDNLTNSSSSHEPVAIRLGHYWNSHNKLFSNVCPDSMALYDADPYEHSKELGDAVTDLRRYTSVFSPSGWPPYVSIEKRVTEGAGPYLSVGISDEISMGAQPYRFSAAIHSNRHAISAYLYILFQSSLFLFYIIMNSRSAKNVTWQISEGVLCDFPIIRFEHLSDVDIGAITLIQENKDQDGHQGRVDDFVEELYRLTKPQSAVIHDHIANLVHRGNNTDVGHVTEENKIAFAGYLRELIAQFCDWKDLLVVVSNIQTEAWSFLIVSYDYKSTLDDADECILRSFPDFLHERYGDSVIRVTGEPNRLLVAIRNGKHLWSKTVARRCAIDIVRSRGLSLSRVKDA